MKNHFYFGTFLVLAVCRGYANGSQISLEDVEKLLTAGDKLDTLGGTDLVLLIGLSGAGKSTLTKFTLHDPSLYSVKVGRTYVLRDNGTISNQTTTSMTLMPNVFKDAETGQIIVDCPGFSDTRDAMHEIAASYFVKRLLDTAKKLKIILVINHSSLISGSDRYGLLNLVTHVSELILNINHFSGSLPLIATKVVNELDVSDEEEIEGIVHFLQETTHGLQDKLQNSRNNKNENYENIIITQKKLATLNVIYNNGSGRNIALFRKPNKGGSPWEIPKMKTNYHDIRELIFHRTPWVDNTNQTYNYTLTAASVAVIEKELIPKYSELVVNEFGNIVDSVSEELKHNIYLGLLDMPKTIELTKTMKSNISTLISEIKGTRDVNLTIVKLLEMTPLDNIDLKPINNNIYKVFFFFAVSKMDENHFLADVKSVLIETKKMLGEFLLFLQFLEKLEKNLDGYDAQSVRNVLYREVQKTNFNDFVFELSVPKIEIDNREQLLTIDLTDELINCLNIILEKKLNYTVTAQQNKKQLMFVARNLLISEVLAKLEDFPTDIDNLTLIASKSIFFDKSLHLNKTDINIIAPRIEVIGNNREITLTGKDETSYAEKADDSTTVNVPGSDGKSGSAGFNAGNLMLLTNDVINPTQLTVKSIGGQGGRGQDGGNGRDGIASKHVTLQDFKVTEPKELENYISNLGYELEMSGKNNYYVIGKKGVVNPSNGGNGGTGGPGGLPGEITLNVRNETSKNLIKLIKIIGKQGDKGQGGKGGVGKPKCTKKFYKCEPYNDKGTCGKWYKRKICSNFKEYDCKSHFPSSFCDGITPAGKPGSDGMSNLGLKENYPITLIDFNQLLLTINETIVDFQIDDSVLNLSKFFII